MAVQSPKFRIVSRGPKAPAQANVKMLADVDIYVKQISERGHRDIRVAEGDDDLEPYEEWRDSRAATRAKGAFP